MDINSSINVELDNCMIKTYFVTECIRSNGKNFINSPSGQKNEELYIYINYNLSDGIKHPFSPVCR